MASRTGYVATESALDVLTTTNFNKMPNGLIGYATTTSTQTGISSVTDLTSLSVTVTANTSRLFKITAYVVVFQQTSTGTVTLSIKESATTLGAGQKAVVASNAAIMHVTTLVTAPSAGSHTYKLTLATSAGTVDTSSSAAQPAWIMVEDVGPSF